MTDPRKVLDDAVEAAARAMARSKAWPVVFEAGSADLLARAAILAALPVIGEAIVAVMNDDEVWASWDVETSAADHIAAAQRAFIERMRG